MDELYISKEIIAQMGLEMTDKEVRQLNESLEEKVGTKITESLSPEQIDELIKIQQSKDDGAIDTWLKQNVPELEALVQKEIELVIKELQSTPPGENTPK